jgi:hypothetical protein
MSHEMGGSGVRCAIWDKAAFFIGQTLNIQPRTSNIQFIMQRTFKVED